MVHPASLASLVSPTMLEMSTRRALAPGVRPWRAGSGSLSPRELSVRRSRRVEFCRQRCATRSRLADGHWVQAPRRLEEMPARLVIHQSSRGGIIPTLARVADDITAVMRRLTPASATPPSAKLLTAVPSQMMRYRCRRPGMSSPVVIRGIGQLLCAFTACTMPDVRLQLLC